MELKRILILGATGKLGKHVTIGLSLGKQQNTRIFVKDRKKAEKIFGNQFEISQGDCRVISDLQNSLADVQGVFINLNIGILPNDEMESLLEGLKNVLVISRMHNVEHVVIQHSLLVDTMSEDKKYWPMFQTIRNSVQLVVNSGLNYTVIKSSLLMEHFPERFQKGNIVNIPEDVNFSAYWVSGNDIGKVARKCFFESNAFGQVITVQGNERIAIKVAAEQYVQSNPGLRLSVGGLNFLQLLSKFRFGGEEDRQWFELLNQQNEEFIFQKNYEFVGEKLTSFKEFSERIFASSKSQFMISA